MRGQPDNNTLIREIYRAGSRRSPWPTDWRRLYARSTTRSSAPTSDARPDARTEQTMRILVHDYSGHPFQAQLSRGAGTPRTSGRPLDVHGLRLRQGRPRLGRLRPPLRHHRGRRQAAQGGLHVRRLGQETRLGRSNWPRQVRREQPDRRCCQPADPGAGGDRCRAAEAAHPLGAVAPGRDRDRPEELRRRRGRPVDGPGRQGLRCG
ncbi:hypothetical protein LT493_12330 [Streptomyces tricolor]|nr:hypothetical protein [Streptomyces tricolor]